MKVVIYFGDGERPDADEVMRALVDRNYGTLRASLQPTTGKEIPVELAAIEAVTE